MEFVYFFGYFNNLHFVISDSIFISKGGGSKKTTLVQSNSFCSIAPRITVLDRGTHQ